MFSFPVNTCPAAVSNHVAMSQMTALSEKLRTASLQFKELNLQAIRRLMEESRTQTQKAMQARTIAEAQKLVSEQSTSSIEKLTGYWQNVGNIALETWGSPRRLVGAVEAMTEPGGPSVPVNDAFMEAPAVITKAREAEKEPSPLPEKLVVSFDVNARKRRSLPKH